MSAEIEILMGAGKGTRCLIGKNSVRIGVGVAADFRLSDPQIRGELLVEWANGTYRVTNLLQHAVYMGQEVLNQDETVVWYDGKVLQASANTALRLQFRPAGADEPGDRVTIIKPGGKYEEELKLIGGLTAAFLLLVGLALLARSGSADGNDPELLILNAFHDKHFDDDDNNKEGIYSRRRYVLRRESLGQLERMKGWFVSCNAENDWKRMNSLMEKADVAERVGDSAAAVQRYRAMASILRKYRQRDGYEQDCYVRYKYEDKERSSDMLWLFINSSLLEAGKK